MSPVRTVLVSYVALISVGTLLFLFLPTTYESKPFIDILFTVTSAVTVTGLTVMDTAKDITPLGQLILLVLIQIGGLGYMTLTTFLLITTGRRIGLKERLILREALNYPGVYGLVRFLRRVMVFVLVAELSGFFALLLLWWNDMEPAVAIFYALFHAVSAFNNAGFSLFSDSLTAYRGDVLVNLVVCTLVILGGLGFFVVNDVYLRFKKKVPRLSTHTKLVVSVSALLLLVGWAGLLLTEAFHTKGIWALDWKEKLLSTLFLSVSARTAGFNTVDISSLSESSLFLLMLLMFVGASPGSTGGGIKTTVFALIAVSVYSYLRGSRDVIIFRRRIPDEQVHRAMVIMAVSFSYIAFVNLLIDRIEEKDFLATLFEVVSAFSTVGLSLGGGEGLSFCAHWSSASKLLLILTMIVGRVGILSFLLALVGRERERRLRYPEAKVLL